MRIDLGAPCRRKPSLTPMIDVVFLLIVFFMLVARFGVDQVIPLPLANGVGDGYRGAPRLVDIHPDSLSLNGFVLEEASLPAALTPLTTEPTDIIVLRGRDGADLQRIVDVAEALGEAGYRALVLAE